MITRSQLIDLGLTTDQARQWVRSGRWRQILPGVYATFTGPRPQLAQLWAAVLYAGEGAVLTGRTALWLAGALDGPQTRPIHIAIPATRRVKRVAGIRFTRSRSVMLDGTCRGSPPMRVLDECVLDACDQAARTDTVIDLVFRVCQRRLTTADRLAAALGRRTRHRWRGLIEDVLTDVADGADSALERRYLRGVERAHGLPHGTRNRPETDAVHSGSVYRDVRYRPWRTVIELDGRGAHPDDQRFRDLRRDNRLVIEGEVSLRYGWHDVAGDPCAVAQQVISLLRARGWNGTPRPCGPGCPLR